MTHAEIFSRIPDAGNLVAFITQPSGELRAVSGELRAKSKAEVVSYVGCWLAARCSPLAAFWLNAECLFMIRSYKGIAPKIPASCYIDESAQVIGDVVLGEHASVWMNAVVRGDVHSIRIGAHSNVQDCSVLHGMKEQYGVFLGEYVTVGHNVVLHGCMIEDRCLIGMGSIILNGAKIGEGSIIAAGTLIPEKTVVEPGSLWMGSPGKFRRKLDEKDQETIMRYANNYLGYKDSYLAERK